jgi:glycosyltransferase involved in cell wall biosynthesis
MASAGVVVSASLREGFSMAVAEALVLGCPVVAVANRGTRELRRRAGRRLTLVDNDAVAMADAIVNCLERHHDRNVQEDLLAQWSTTAAVRFHSEKVEELMLGRGPD